MSRNSGILPLLEHEGTVDTYVQNTLTVTICRRTEFTERTYWWWFDFCRLSTFECSFNSLDL